MKSKLLPFLLPNVYFLFSSTPDGSRMLLPPPGIVASGSRCYSRDRGRCNQDLLSISGEQCTSQVSEPFVGRSRGVNKRAEKIKAFYLRTDADRQQHGEEHDRPELRYGELRQSLGINHKHQTRTCNIQEQKTFQYKRYLLAAMFCNGPKEKLSTEKSAISCHVY